MKYHSFYFYQFRHPMKEVLVERYGRKYARGILKKSRKIYRKPVEGADDIGDDNPMAYNETFALVFVAPCLASEKEIPPGTIQEMVRRSLYFAKWFFSLTNLNTKRGKEANKRNIIKYYKRYTEEKEKLYPILFEVNFEREPYEGTCYYRVTRCPICIHTKELGVHELTPLFCELDEVTMNFQHGVLHKKGTIVNGADCCSYPTIGDRG